APYRAVIVGEFVRVASKSIVFSIRLDALECFNEWHINNSFDFARCCHILWQHVLNCHEWNYKVVRSHRADCAQAAIHLFWPECDPNLFLRLSQRGGKKRAIALDISAAGKRNFALVRL